MNKTKLTALILAVIMIVCSLASCGDDAISAITFRDTVITENEYIYLMGKYKASFIQSLGYTADNPNLWTLEMTEGVTVADFCEALAINDFMMIAVSIQLFDEYGLELTKDEKKAIEDAVAQFKTTAGGNSQLNSYLSAYGINSDMLKDILLDQLKAAKLQEYLFGENGINAPTETDIANYFKENYYRTQYILIRTDKDYLYDENGTAIKNEDGSYQTRDLTEEEAAENLKLAKDIELRLTSGEDFEKLMLEYTMDLGMLYFPDGYYFNSSATYIDEEVKNAVSAMTIDEIKSVETDYGYYIIKRLDLRDGVYNDELYAPMFTDLTASVTTVVMQTIFSSFSDEILLNEQVVDDYPIESCTANFNY